uniref:Rhodopsin domain-containing protein n=1 Tax=Bionectria ochroleuca TaxID=29856 RepID=A0A8H7K1M4_BIOOC
MKDDDVLTIVGAIGAILGIIFVAIRFYARHMTNNKIGWDDWCILISTIAVIGGDVLVVVANSMYPNSAEAASHKDPSYEYTKDDIHYTKLSFGATSIYFTTVSATKLSILLMYNRIFSISNSFRRQILLLISLTATFG